LGQAIQPKVSEYGLEINRIEIQELRLPKDIQEAIDRVASAMLLPARTEQEVHAKEMELKMLARVLGGEAAALNQIVSNFRGAAVIGGLPEMLGNLIAEAAKTPDGGRPSLARPAKAVEAPGSDMAAASPVSAVPQADGSAEKQIQCPRCHRAFGVAVSASQPDQTLACPHCQKPVRVRRRGKA
jgi:hypothetical protein